MNVAFIVFLMVAAPVGAYLAIALVYFISWTTDLIEKQDGRTTSILAAALAAALWPLTLTASSARLSIDRATGGGK